MQKTKCMLAVLAALVVPSFAQTKQPEPVRIEQLMNAASRRKTGIEQLVPLERKLLNDWLASHLELLDKAAFGDTAPGAPYQHEALYAIDLAMLMSPDELRDTGIARLRPKQRQALNDWMTSHIGQDGWLSWDKDSQRDFEEQLALPGLERALQESGRREKEEADLAYKIAHAQKAQGVTPDSDEGKRIDRVMRGIAQDKGERNHVTISIISNPAGADIEVDGKFLGNTPAELPLSPGRRTIKLSKKGYKGYQRTVEVLPEGTQRVAVELEHE